MDILVAKGVLLGGIALGSVVAGLFFLRFWKVTGDRLFLFFSLAFFMLAVSRVLMSITVVPSDEYPVIYVIGMIGYGLIILGIIEKNFNKSPSSVSQAEHFR